ncbi:hypothetical protein K438DRAFT_1790110 [Mycena galopus ATCC 62051]|nr:hypothetical protein K438DRAFT_1790110 [Mycena galopus ATCC 62051]
MSSPLPAGAALAQAHTQRMAAGAALVHALGTTTETAARAVYDAADNAVDTARAAADAYARSLLQQTFLYHPAPTPSSASWEDMIKAMNAESFAPLAGLSDGLNHPHGVLLALRRAWRRHHGLSEGAQRALGTALCRRLVNCATFAEVASILEDERITDDVFDSARTMWRVLQGREDIPDDAPDAPHPEDFDSVFGAGQTPFKLEILVLSLCAAGFFRSYGLSKLIKAPLRELHDPHSPPPAYLTIPSLAPTTPLRCVVLPFPTIQHQPRLRHPQLVTNIERGSAISSGDDAAGDALRLWIIRVPAVAQLGSTTMGGGKEPKKKKKTAEGNAEDGVDKPKKKKKANSQDDDAMDVDGDKPKLKPKPKAKPEADGGAMDGDEPPRPKPKPQKKAEGAAAEPPKMSDAEEGRRLNSN